MYLPDEIQSTLRNLNKITENEVVQKQGDIYVAINVLTSERRILLNEQSLIESLEGRSSQNKRKILKGWLHGRKEKKSNFWRWINR